MFKKLLFVGFFHLLILPSAFAFGDFFKKIDDAFENLNEVLEETEKPIKKESLQQKKSPVIKKDKLISILKNRSFNIQDVSENDLVISKKTKNYKTVELKQNKNKKMLKKAPKKVKKSSKILELMLY